MNPANDWIDQARQLLDAWRAGPGQNPAGDPPAAGAHSSDCRWCPVCQVAAVVRGERPEVTAALADVLTATATALRTFATAGDPPGAATGDTAAGDTASGDTASGDTASEAREGDDPDADDPPPAVQRIEIA
jgi:hypothetical protein